ncbi:MULTISPECIES: hypothetical protein [unclassified Flavobacterium]|uniref:hypothetical protein n=1 Tax=unclassified Flavobacterium TaxID=196869 RepID=UPI003F8F3779
MKKNILLIVLSFSLGSFAQNKENSSFKITQKECLKKSGFTLVLKSVITDSRCPEGVTCIWMGEAQIVVSVYKDKKLMEDKTLVLSAKKEQENQQWFATYLPVKYKKVQTIDLEPYPKKDKPIVPKDYFLKIGYLK